ncbi:Spy/CpxP family protein refolding chaperone [Hansschlegelia zhihuaiae]|uniref:Periplasmic heavy metal sensor n=1 Tax=Hansschlegelia zhihuaiae TaxID=405005 RepID=A0A4Q0MK80_9HYPH|nr:periplasmic heavy metal sensor [Hansschlegelia zhihuaiae]RXF74157.1 periplasmic heavy metal sensor [Hansschlegelia zhihuaiae]
METQNADQTPPTGAKAPARRGRRVAAAAAIGLGAVSLGIVAAIAAAPDDRFGPHGGLHGVGAFLLERRIDGALDAVDATAEQEKKIWAIVDATRADLRPRFREFRDARGQFVQALSAGTVDRAAVEKLRAERVAAVDATSKKIAEAAVEAAEVLTPEQRAKLADRLKDRGGHGPW